MDQSKKILITGGFGLVGSAFDFPKEEVFKACRKDADLTSYRQTCALFERVQPEYVIHCAAKVGGVKANMDYKGEFYYDNMCINMNVIEACRIYGVKKILNFASTCVFPDKPSYPLTEDQIFNGPPHHSNYPYAYAKRMAMVQLSAYAEQYGLNHVTVIPCNIYGPRDNYDEVNGHVIPALISKCVKAKEEQKDFVVWGSGKPTREFIFSKDVAYLAKQLLLNETRYSSYIVSPFEEHSIAEIATLIATVVGFEGKIVFDSDKPDGQFKKPSNNQRLTDFMCDNGLEFCFTPLNEGLDEAVDYYKSFVRVMDQLARAQRTPKPKAKKCPHGVLVPTLCEACGDEEL